LACWLTHAESVLSVQGEIQQRSAAAPNAASVKQWHGTVWSNHWA
jgi:hypothetical protein